MSNIPHLFRCPISLDLFTDPVTLSTGQTYDRPSIEKWLAGGNSTCPVTMQILHDTSLVPNHTLRHLIDRWLLSGPEPNSRPNDKSKLSLASLKHNLQSPDTGIATKMEILEKVRILSSESDIGQAGLIQLGFFQHLIQMLFHITSPGALDEELVELVLDCVLNLLPSTQLEYLNMIKNEASLASFILLLEQGNLRIKIGLCHLMETIATSVVNRELCVMLGQNHRVLRAVVSLLQQNRDARASEAAVRAVSGFCSIETNRAGAVSEGAVDGLVSYLMHSTHRIGIGSKKALATLEILAESEDGKKSLIKNSDAVKVLVKYVFNNEGSESAVGTLLIACRESGKSRSEAVSAGVLMQLLLLLQSQCGTKGKAKGRALLKLLRSVWAREPGMGSNLQRFK